MRPSVGIRLGTPQTPPKMSWTKTLTCTASSATLSRERSVCLHVDTRPLGGADRLVGGPGNDTAYGDDVLSRQRGRDWLYGGLGKDGLFAGPKGDRVFGNRGRDRLDGEAGRDRLDGGPQTDECEHGETVLNCEA